MTNKYAEPILKTLSSGWLRIEFGPQIFAQIPPGFVGEVIPDEYIFQPEWSREIVNDWWMIFRSARQ